MMVELGITFVTPFFEIYFDTLNKTNYIWLGGEENGGAILELS